MLPKVTDNQQGEKGKEELRTAVWFLNDLFSGERVKQKQAANANTEHLQSRRLYKRSSVSLFVFQLCQSNTVFKEAARFPIHSIFKSTDAECGKDLF